MISKLPRWVWAGGAILAFCAGMINVIAILGFVHKGITHVTGNTSLFSIAAASGDRQTMLPTLSILVSFFAGSVLAGVIIGDGRLRMGRRYGVALAVECGLLLASAQGFVRGSMSGEYFASMAAGLQNAMASTYSEAIVRTTHMTGIVTDLGSLIGNRLRGLALDTRRIRLLSIIFFSFLAGGSAGTFFYVKLGPKAMYVPAAIIGFSAAGYEVFRRRFPDASQKVR